MATGKPAKKKGNPISVSRKKADNRFNYEAIINWIAFGLYSLIILYGTSCHEPWRDEAQSWLIARDNTLTGLFKYLPHEGHPPGWYLLIMPFAKLGFPLVTANIINNLISIGCAWLILFKSRLPVYLRLALVFSYFMLFEYALIARNYSMVGLMIFAIIAFYDDRFKKPLLYGFLIFLFFQTNVLAFSAGAGLGLIYFIEIIVEKRFAAKNFIALGIMAAGGLAVMVLLLSAGLTSDYTAVAKDKYGAVVAAFGDALLLDKTSAAGLVLYIILALALFRKPLVLVFLGVGLAGYCYLIAYKFQGTFRHHGFGLIFLGGAYALALRYKPLKIFEKLNWIETGAAVLFSVAVIAQGIKGIHFLQEDIERDFSDSKNAADFINRNQLYNYTLVGHHSFAASALLPYLPNHKALWYPDTQRYGTYLYLDTAFFHNYQKYDADYAAYMSEKTFKNQDSVILLLNMPLKYKEFMNRWELIYHSTDKPIKTDEVYYIYRRRHIPAVVHDSAIAKSK